MILFNKNDNITLSTQLLQIEQWELRGGLYISHVFKLKVKILLNKI